MKTIFLLLCLPFVGMAQQTIKIEEPLNQKISLEENLANGAQLSDLSWAWQSNNACFVSIQQHKFTGNHVFFEGVIPKYTELTATVIPKDPSQNFSIYAFQTGIQNDAVPPDLASCIRCEADYKWDRKWSGKTQDHTRTVKHLLAINNPYRLVIAVVGAEGLTEGDFTLVIEPVNK
ncbi:hypothetical protein [Altibacter sp. HG106]|uniref:hypothetical protein n=1 Tax=Altibacter sp. HG106 TaxID=3023937 RepID=UPI0023500CB6|nr:hypothetical protein [Altibacter sp. HG106]MDC7995312.1 hypothetical protein [Altibacter sp. HG106]